MEERNLNAAYIVPRTSDQIRINQWDQDGDEHLFEMKRPRQEIDLTNRQIDNMVLLEDNQEDDLLANL